MLLSLILCRCGLAWLYIGTHGLQRQTHNPSEKLGQTGCTLEVGSSILPTCTLSLPFYQIQLLFKDRAKRGIDRLV